MSRRARASMDTPAPSDASYEADYLRWTERQAALLRSGRLDQADLANIAEEIETLGRFERAALESAYRRIVLHLLTLQFQPERRSRNWIATIMRERLNAARLLRDNPSLESKQDDLFASAYRDARKDAASETGLPLSTFPVTEPFSLEQLVDEDFLPSSRD